MLRTRPSRTSPSIAWQQGPGGAAAGQNGPTRGKAAPLPLPARHASRQLQQRAQHASQHAQHEHITRTRSTRASSRARPAAQTAGPSRTAGLLPPSSPARSRGWRASPLAQNSPSLASVSCRGQGSPGAAPTGSRGRQTWRGTEVQACADGGRSRTRVALARASQPVQQRLQRQLWGGSGRAAGPALGLNVP